MALTRILVVSLSLVVVALLAMACDPSHAITYENRTNESLEILYNGRFNFSLEPGETKTVDEIEFDDATFSARTSDGRVIYSRDITWEELEDEGWRIIITDI